MEIIYNVNIQIISHKLSERCETLINKGIYLFIIIYNSNQNMRLK